MSVPGRRVGGLCVCDITDAPCPDCGCCAVCCECDVDDFDADELGLDPEG